MANTYVKAAAGSVAVPETAQYVKGNDQALHAMRQEYEYQHRLKDGSLTEYEDVWVLQAEYGPPWITVPGVSLSQGPELIGSTTYTVGWTIATDSGDAAYAWNVRVEWYKAGVRQFTDVVPQSAGGKQRTDFNVQDQIQCVLGYVNSNGSGDTVPTDTV